MWIRDQIAPYRHAVPSSITSNSLWLRFDTPLLPSYSLYDPLIEPPSSSSYYLGSGQQSVTTMSTQSDSNSLWVIKESSDGGCDLGVPVQCGVKIRLGKVGDRYDGPSGIPHNFPLTH